VCVYRHGRVKNVILCLYVDDILIFGINIDVINEVKSFLSKSFDMKDVGQACQDYYLQEEEDEQG
jgi:hypothetical protein